VDDETDARELITKIFRRAGANVNPAGSMQEALALYREQRPDLIVSDVGMPEHDGLELIRKIREIERQDGKFTPAAALTAYARKEDRDQALAAGFQAHVAKPVETAALIRVAENLIEA
jgi:CheY-like chemotaxis protein